MRGELKGVSADSILLSYNLPPFLFRPLGEQRGLLGGVRGGAVLRAIRSGIHPMQCQAQAAKPPLTHTYDND